MATWELTTEYKKSALERQHWCKDGKTIIREEGYRWGKFYCESDEKPDIDLSGDDEEYELGGDEYEWELDELDDGCWADWTWPADMSDEDREAIEEAWDENNFEGLEELGWSNDDTVYFFQGPLKLTNTDTGEEFTSTSEEEDESKFTPWHQENINPGQVGTYECVICGVTAWPFPQIKMAEWTGTEWQLDGIKLSEGIKQWRGLVNNPETETQTKETK